MAENDQHLKHGKALCGKVFGRFVETFNALVDFMLGIKGDADGKNGEGHITYDRKNNIFRCDGCGGKGGSGSDVTANEKSGLTVDNGEIDIAGREEDHTFGIRTMTVKGEDDAEDKTVKFLGTDDIAIPGGAALGGVKSLNGEDGDMQIVGGSSIRVNTEGKVITIGYEEGKEPDPTGDPCEHPGGGEGVALDGFMGGGIGGGGGGGGGAPLDGPSTHPGNPCNDCD